MIRKREPLELSEQIMPKLLDAVQCLRCGHVWGALRPVGADVHIMQCPFCEAQDTEFLQEAPRMWASVH